MSEHMTESFDAYESEPNYDWDYRQDERGPRILWGRVAIFGAALLVAFFVGRATVDRGSGVSAEQFQNTSDELTAAQEEIDRLETELAQALAPDAQADPTASPTDSTVAEEPAGETYVVEKNDTLLELAQRFYGDPELDDCIAEANDITDPTQLSVGQELIIPDESTC